MTTRIWAAVVLGFSLLAALAVPARAQVCTGDCNGNEIVAINEVITCVNIGLELLTLDQCELCDQNGNELVAINEIITAVNIGLGTLTCGGGPTRTPTEVPTAAPTRTPGGPADTFPTSLHNLRTGQSYFYAAAQGGFETLTGVPYDEISCQNCHAPTLADGTPIDGASYQPSCADCHSDPANPSGDIPDTTCLGCHSRQAAEKNLYSDVHRDMGFGCVMCHKSAEVHGSGTSYNTLLDSPGVHCVNCHSAGGLAGPPPANTAHSIHIAAVDCSSCHVRSVISCFNCHFDSEVAGGGKRYLAPPLKDFKLLVNFQRPGDSRKKVYPATFMGLVYGGDKSFYAIAPYYAHTVTDDVQCSNCHNSAAIQEYNSTGHIVMTKFDNQTLRGPSGVVPVPPDWQEALVFDFVDYTGDAANPTTDPALWQYMKTGADGTQMLRGEPLTTQQMQKLSLDLGG